MDTYTITGIQVISGWDDLLTDVKVMRIQASSLLQAIEHFKRETKCEFVLSVVKSGLLVHIHEDAYHSSATTPVNAV